jgi:hypothetical protein
MKRLLIFCLLFAGCSAGRYSLCLERDSMTHEDDTEKCPLVAKIVNDRAENECPSCLEELTGDVVTLSKKGNDCGHRYHKSCLKKWRKQEKKRTKSGERVIYTCPVCQIPYNSRKEYILNFVSLLFSNCS